MTDVNKEKGVLAWFAGNHVAANLLMFLIFAGGLLSIATTNVELFPDTSLDLITVSVPYLGASPAEVEEGVNIRVEEAVAGIEGIKRLRSTAAEGMGTVIIEVDDYADPKEVLDDVEAEVGRIITFPQETEKPIVTEVTTRRQVISIVLYGDVSERSLKHLAERMRDDLTAMENISQVDISGARRYEISIEVSEESLRRYNLSFDELSRAVGRGSLDLPGGSVKTVGGEILIRTKGQKYTGAEFENIVVRTRPNGTKILVKDVAEVIDGFEDSDILSRFDGRRSVMLQVYRIGDQDVLDLSRSVKKYVNEIRGKLPEGVLISTWFDRSRILKSRIELLLRNAGIGLVLVFLTLLVFLDFKLAFWTTMGIPISFMGAVWVLPYFDTSINMMSLFAFILALGIVVDDAIVVGENIFEYRQQGMSALSAAVKGVKEMAGPVTMAVLTTIFAFMPLLYIYGIFGKFIRVVPIVVISVLSFSLIESLLILPAHLSSGKVKLKGNGSSSRLGKVHDKVHNMLDGFINGRFARFVERAVRWRYVTLACGFLVLILTIGYVRGGHIKFSLMPKVDADNVWATLSMPKGTSVEQTKDVVTILESSALELREEIDSKRGSDKASIFTHISTSIGQQPFSGGGPARGGDNESGSHAAEVNIELLAAEKRGNISSEEIRKRWSKKVGEIAGVSSLTFTSSLFSGGDAIYVEMSHYSFEKLLDAVEELKEKLREYSGVRDIEDSFEPGKVEIKLELTDQGKLVGLRLDDLARQVRQGFYGDEVQRIQRGRDDIRVMVRYPYEERKSIADIENMRIRLPDGAEVPFGFVAKMDIGRGYAVINRADRRRVVSVTADVDQKAANANEINASLRSTVLPELKSRYPNLLYNFEGEQKEQREIGKSLGSSSIIALLAIFGLLAIQFRSYLQPTIIMSAIPFGLVGAIIGHVVMGFYLSVSKSIAYGSIESEPFNLSILSIFGIVALTGIVVNDSLIMVDLINRRRKDESDGSSMIDFITSSATRRFRPIMLTTLTTFIGLVPMMLEKSLQARFLIPMAVSLAFGVLFATVITLVLVPSLYMILEDFKGMLFRSGKA